MFSSKWNLFLAFIWHVYTSNHSGLQLVFIAGTFGKFGVCECLCSFSTLGKCHSYLQINLFAVISTFELLTQGLGWDKLCSDPLSCFQSDYAQRHRTLGLNSCKPAYTAAPTSSVAQIQISCLTSHLSKVVNICFAWSVRGTWVLLSNFWPDLTHWESLHSVFRV